MNAKKILRLVTAACLISMNSASGMQPLGLTNFGATCYVNATIQALYNCTSLTQFLLNHNINYPYNGLANRYVQLLKGMRAVAANGATDDLLQQLWGMELNSFVQQAYAVMGGCGHMDATEFITSLLTDLKEDAPAFQNIFSIGQASIVQCPSIQYERTRIDQENLLNLQAEGFTTLTECLTSYFSTEELKDAYALDLSPQELAQRPDLTVFNKGLIPGCSRRIAIGQLGEIAILALKRFARDIKTNSSRKLSHNIEIEQTLNFGAFMTEHAATVNSTNYELIGAIVHSGSLRVGHYIAYVKVGNQWYKCNDEAVEPVSWVTMVNPPEQWKEYGINKSYALFYKRGATGSIEPTVAQPQSPKKPSTQDATLAKALKALQTALDALYATLIQ